MKSSGLIVDRPVPKKNFPTLEAAFIYYTDCQVATFFDYVSRKSQSKSSVRRQKTITDGMVSEIYPLNATPQRDAVIERYSRALEQYRVYFEDDL